MSKKRDRLNKEYRFCPICGRKTIIIVTEGRLWKEKTYIECFSCRKVTYVRERI